MNSRELLQSRRMNEKGDTLWEDSPLVQAAREGEPSRSHPRLLLISSEIG